MTDHDPRAADANLFGQNAIDVANRIARYVATNTDAHNWSPQRWAYEAVLVILGDEGAAYDVLRCMEGGSAYDLAVIPVGSIPPWMESIEHAVDTRHVDPSVPLYVRKENPDDV